MGAAAKPRTREQELRAAIKKSGLPYAAISLYTALLDKADWSTANMRFQPKSLAVVAGWADMSESYCKKNLNVLEASGWIERKRAEVAGRGHSTSYALLLGQSRERRGQRPLTEAQRARRYRERKRAPGSVTRTDPEGAPDSVTPPEPDSPERGSGLRDEGDTDCVTKGTQVRDVDAAQARFTAGGHQGGEEGRTPAADDLVRCQFCQEWGGGELGPIQHAPGCWTGEMWKIYEAEL